MIESLLEVHRRAQAAGHGGKAAVYADACRSLGLSLATLHARLNEVAVRPTRKRRSDAGQVALTLAEAQTLSAVMMEGYRANNKRILALREALAKLRANVGGFACAVDHGTGEMTPLSETSCARALRQYNLHPDQLRQPAPSRQLASDHPNDVWQLDFSISTLFYVPGEGQSGMQDMAPAEFYSGKPGNFEKIKRQRLLRGIVTDHTSGSIFVHYLAGGESLTNMAELFLTAVAQRPGQEMYGVPFHLMVDPGSGAGGAFKNLLRRLDVTLIVNQPGNPRAKGQVENAHNLVETSFESGFKFSHVPDIAWINDKAMQWMRWYNSAQIHSRHGRSRWDKWREITASQLRLVDAALARQLLTHEPATPKVDVHLRVRFAGRLWSLADVEGINVGDKIAITYNPFDPACAWLVQHDAEGREQLIAVPEAQVDEHGFAADAARIGREYKAMPDTPAMTNKKRVERMATGTATDTEAAASRKAKQLPFGGAFDPYKHHADLPVATPLPRRGTALQPMVTTAVAERRLNHFDAARRLVAEHGVTMNPELLATLRGLHPDGVPEDQLADLAARLTVRAGLQLVSGGA